MARNSTLYCSFCGKSQHKVLDLIATGRTVCICNECVGVCADIITKRDRARARAEAAAFIYEDRT